MATSTSVDLVCADPQQVHLFWPHVSHLLRSAIQRTGLSDWEETERSILDGKALLWLAWDGEKIISAAATTLAKVDRQKICTLVACGGEDMMQWFPLLEKIEGYARDEGCDCVRIFGRKGWARMLKDYEMTNIVLERAL